MEFSIRRVSALLNKEIKDLSKNMNVSIMFLLPIFFAVIYSNMFGGNSAEKIYIFNLCLGMNIVMVGAFVMAMLIAEEKKIRLELL